MKKYAYLFILLFLIATVVIIAKYVGRSETRSANVVVATVVQPLATEGPEDLTEINFKNRQEKLLVDRVDKGLPIENNVHRTVRERVVAEDTQQSIENIGELWGTVEGSSLSGSLDNKSTKWLGSSLAGNIRVHRVIEDGLKERKKVEAAILGDLHDRIDKWPKTVDDYESAVALGGGGYGRDDKGKVIGDRAGRVFFESQYAIPAEMFILANYHSQEALPLVSAFAKRIDLILVPDSNGVIKPRRHPLSRMINIDYAFWTAIVLLQENHAERYSKIKEFVKTDLRPETISQEITVTTSKAFWNVNDYAVISGRVDISGEPKMKLLIAASNPLSKIARGDKEKVLVALAVADRYLPVECDPFK